MANIFGDDGSNLLLGNNESDRIDELGANYTIIPQLGNDASDG